MMISHEEWHDGWYIYSTFEEDLPEGWNPGNPMRYAGRGFAEFRHPHQYDGTWTSTQRINFPDETKLFAVTSNEASRLVVEGLKAKINSRKVPK